jgi:crotonobetainyl-CoA:carnitine CoA-transferase CaiB-like acyl-CoA transferase
MSDESQTYDPPLAGVEVIDLITGPMSGIGRILTDLGASVTHVDFSDAAARSTSGPRIGGHSLDALIAGVGMRHEVIDRSSSAGEARWTEIVQRADILLEDTAPGSKDEADLDVASLRLARPELVILSVSDFGRGNDFSRWTATAPVFHALTSEQSRSGIPGREPVIPPGPLPYGVAAAQAVFMTLAAYVDRGVTGVGDHLDFSVLDGAMQALDPPFGMTGSAAGGVPLSKAPRGRAEERYKYPIIRCADGFVRICVLAPRQWRGMFEWMGRPEEFADPAFDNLAVRFASTTLLPAIGAFFADKTREELESQGQLAGVPIASVLDLEEALRSPQATARGVFHDVELSDGIVAPVPNGIMEIDGVRARVIEHREASPVPLPAVLRDRPREGFGRPLEGLRVLDLGVIVVGGDTGRLFADLGADVIKIENSAYLDGSRAALTSGPMSAGFAAGHRNKRSIGINLRSPEGAALIADLVKQSDIVLTNFKPGVMQSLGLDYDTLKSFNEGIVVVDSSAFGPTGPWAKRLGYGPLVRAAAGLTSQWVYDDDPESFSDAVTVYPDHVCARIGAIGALALLIRRGRTSRGGSVSIAQSEVMLSHMATRIASDRLIADGLSIEGLAPDAPWGLYPAAGEDNWVAVTVRGDADWQALASAIGREDLAADPTLTTAPGRASRREELDAAVSEWTTTLAARDIMTRLQAAGVPAGEMLRAAELPDWEYYVQRRAFRQEWHPHMDEPMPYENAQIGSSRIPDPPMRPAPLLGEQTREVATHLLGLDSDVVEVLLERGVLEESPTVRAERQETPGTASTVA